MAAVQKATRSRASSAERRAQLVAAAAVRFHHAGYHRVSLGTVAEDLGLTGPAIYRHVRNKEELLALTIGSGLDLVEEALEDTRGRPLDELVGAVADIGVRRPDLWTLLHRESRFLGDELRGAVRAQFDRVMAGIASAVRQERPSLSEPDARLLVAAATAVLASPSTSTTNLQAAESRTELVEAALGALRVDLAGAPERSDGQALDAEAGPGDRHTEVVDAAMELFFERGYGAVTIDDIGAALGMAGPSVYHHISAKADILAAGFERATTRLATGRRRRAEVAEAPSLERLVRTHIRFCLHNRSLIGVYVSERANLPDDEERAVVQAICDGTEEWAAALRTSVPGLAVESARVRVQAALATIHDVVRVGSLHTRPRIAGELEVIVHAVLGIAACRG